LFCHETEVFKVPHKLLKNVVSDLLEGSNHCNIPYTGNCSTINYFHHS